MNFDELVDKYFEEIEIGDTDYLPEDDCEYDIAYILLRIPLDMLRDYQRLKGRKEKELPNGSEFWLETKLCEKLMDSNKYNGQGHEPLEDILEFLEVDVNFNYQELGQHNSRRIRLSISEIPKKLQ